MSKALHFVLTRVFNTPLLIHPQKLDAIVSAIQPRLPEALSNGLDVSLGEPVEIEVNGRTGHEVAIAGEVAVIPVYGSLVQRAHGLDAMSGLTSYASLERQLNEALDDPRVAAILFDVDSPGGEASGCFEFVDRIYEAREHKPIFGLVNEQAFSGGYAIVSACETIWAPRTGNVGSIGAVCTHFDYSGKAKKEGVVVTHIYAGSKKVDGSPYKPLSSTALKDIQGEIDELYEVFVETVARNRGITPAAVRATQAGSFLGKSAVNAGLVDEIISIADLPAKLQEAMMKREQKQAGVTGGSLNTRLESDPELDKRLAAAEEEADEDEDEEEAKRKAKQKAKRKAEAEDEDEDEESAKKAKRKTEEDEDEDEEEEQAKKKTASVARHPTVEAASRRDAAEIVRLCTVARQPVLAAEFIEKGLTLSEAKAALFDRLAEQDPVTINAVNPLRGGESEGEQLLVSAMRVLNDQKSGRR